MEIKVHIMVEFVVTNIVCVLTADILVLKVISHSKNYSSQPRKKNALILNESNLALSCLS